MCDSIFKLHIHVYVTDLFTPQNLHKWNLLHWVCLSAAFFFPVKIMKVAESKMFKEKK